MTKPHLPHANDTTAPNLTWKDFDHGLVAEIEWFKRGLYFMYKGISSCSFLCWFLGNSFDSYLLLLQLPQIVLAKSLTTSCGLNYSYSAEVSGRHL